MEGHGEATALVRAIEAAFGNLSVPGDDNLVLNDSGSHLECNQVKAKFRGRHWRSLSLSDLTGEADSLAFFTPEAFRFFLPAFVRASVLDYDRSDLIPMVVVGALMRPTDPCLASYHEARIATLTGKQKRVLRQFLSFLRERHAGHFTPGELDLAQESLAV